MIAEVYLLDERRGSIAGGAERPSNQAGKRVGKYLICETTVLGKTRTICPDLDLSLPVICGRYIAWAKEDSRLVGIAPWHYANRPSSMGKLSYISSEGLLGRPAGLAARNTRGVLSGFAGESVPPPSYVNPGTDHGAAQYPKFVGKCPS